MSDYEDPQPKTMIAKMGPGTFRLTLEDESKVKLEVEEIHQRNRWTAEGVDMAGRLHYKLEETEPGGPLVLEERENADEEWAEVGEVTYAEDL